MEIVARHLQQQAWKVPEPTDADLFGRAAFNRYYYATYLNVREGLGTLEAAWRRTPHGAIPDLFKGKIQQELKRGGKQATRFKDAEVAALCARGVAAAYGLSEVMTAAYAVRVVADYEPEVLVRFYSSHGFSLNEITIDEAKSWQAKANNYLKTIIQAWKQVNA